MSWLTEAFRPNHCYENGGDTWRLWIGDLAYWNENEGGHRAGSMLTFEIGFGDQIGDFDEESHTLHWADGKAYTVRHPDARKFLTRWITVQIWRWGFTFNWRGPEITGTDWGIPRWHFDKHGELLEDYR